MISAESVSSADLLGLHITLSSMSFILYNRVGLFLIYKILGNICGNVRRKNVQVDQKTIPIFAYLMRFSGMYVILFAHNTHISRSF